MKEKTELLYTKQQFMFGKTFEVNVKRKFACNIKDMPANINGRIKLMYFGTIYPIILFSTHKTEV